MLGDPLDSEAGAEVLETRYTLRPEAIDDRSGRHGFFYLAGTSTIVLALPSASLRLIRPVEYALTLHPTGLGRVTIARRSDGS